MTTAVTTRRSARKPKGDGHLRRAEILEAAERIFVAQGYEGATIRKIADEVGVSSTALYMHFPDKGAILLEICERTIIQLLERNAAIASKPLDAVTRVKQMLDSYMRWGFEHPNAYLLVFAGVHPVSTIWHEGTADMSARCYEIFSGAVREIAAEGRLRTGTGDSAAQALWAACHGVVALMIGRPNFDWAPVDEVIQVTLDGLMHGLVID
ncbi:MAG: TetR/AcrR family transcriptional regulator [Phenylobacterium sp.]|uniref:TetR/AcrR family transcriptional regulator n=1 Tax=Phenylobacterium sp. TaxID=1871053 RepID=UPI002724486F|nr:TetR/AcrR family transcriptional regulator [Phenylobacterium sp.]MDO8910270.1 TetR/AcrR family transcriptional regulator [Phenylobacterium sp.]MDP3102800.1 TetR/AcrR family transcriptional regulator [Phenylobacterium sp.]